MTDGFSSGSGDGLAEAAAILGLSVGASADDVRRRYQELFSDYQVRLTNAPTPTLKRMYQKNLQELEAAQAKLLAEQATDLYEDLPSAEPAYRPVAAPVRPPRPVPPPAPEPPAPPHPDWTPPAPTHPKPAIPTPPPARAEAGSKSRAMPIAIWLVLVGVVAAAYFLKSGGAGGAARPTVPADSIATIREDLSVAKVSLDRGEYEEAVTLVVAVERHLDSLGTRFAPDSVAVLKAEAGALSESIAKACQAERQIAAQRGDAPPKCPVSESAAAPESAASSEPRTVFHDLMKQGSDAYNDLRFEQAVKIARDGLSAAQNRAQRILALQLLAAALYPDDPPMQRRADALVVVRELVSLGVNTVPIEQRWSGIDSLFMEARRDGSR